MTITTMKQYPRLVEFKPDHETMAGVVLWLRAPREGFIVYIPPEVAAEQGIFYMDLQAPTPTEIVDFEGSVQMSNYNDPIVNLPK